MRPTALDHAALKLATEYSTCAPSLEPPLTIFTKEILSVGQFPEYIINKDKPKSDKKFLYTFY